MPDETPPIVEPKLTVGPTKIQLEWKMAVESGTFVFPFDVLQVRLYCRPFPKLGEPRMLYPPLDKVQYTQTRGAAVGSGIGGSAGWEITREAFRPGWPTEDEGERYEYYPVDLHLQAVKLTTDKGKVRACIEWTVESDWMSAPFRCWATFGYVTPIPGPHVGEYLKVADTKAFVHDPGQIPEPSAAVDSDSAPTIFLSYQRDSETEAAKIRNYLQRAGFHVWQDVDNIRGTARWPIAVDHALRETDRIVVLLTQKSMESDEVFNEWFFFYQHRKPIHCLMIETCEPHYQLLPFQYLDWREPVGRDWPKLVSELTVPFEWPSVARKEKVIGTVFAPERTLPEALAALHEVLLSEEGVIALRDEQIDAIKKHKPANETEFRLVRYAEWCGPRYQLDERFVRLTMLLDQGSEAQQRFVAQEGHKRFSDLRDVLAEEKSHTLVLLGDPGAGKSTLLRRLEMDTSVDALRDVENRTLTFFVNLAEYGVGRRDDDLPLPLDWLSEKWTSQYPDLPPLDTLLHERRMLLLLDSLNEMPHTNPADFRRKADLWRAFLYDYVRDRPGNRALFACRTLDYGAVLSTDEYPIPQVRLEAMTREQVRDYLDNYAPEHAALIWASFEHDPRQFELFRIPFMLQMLVERVKLDGRIPQGRAETFNGFVHSLLCREVKRRNPLFENGVLLHDRELKRLREGRPPRTPYDLPDRGLLIPSLTALAYTMQQRKPGEEKGLVMVDYDDALDLLPGNGNRDSVLRAGCAMNVLDELDDRIRYYHQLVQEFFAARKLADTPQPELVRVEWHVDYVTPTLKETLHSISDNDPLPLLPNTGWEETTVLAAAMSPDPNAFVRALLETNLPLAARCAAAPDVNVSDELCDKIRQALIARTQNLDADLRARIAAGLALGEIGDPRFERRTGSFGDYLLPPMIPIEGGEYTIGSDEGLYDREEPVHPVAVDSFEMGHFPVTNAEYALFMAADGYEDEQWWETDAAKAWQRGESASEGPKQQWRDDKKTLESWSEDYIRGLVTQNRITSKQADDWIIIRRWTDERFEQQLDEWYPAGPQTQPDFWDDSVYNSPAQPVVGICWHEARAYCAWLSAQTGQKFRLPTEAEWEAAARGFESRRYPYGPDFDVKRSNTFESHIRRTTPIGVFPGGETPEGLVDMSGNVWDWTSTAYRDYPYRADDGREDSTDAAARRVVRGGSWSSYQDSSRAAYRYWFDPSFRSDIVGFRLVRVPHL